MHWTVATALLWYLLPTEAPRLQPKRHHTHTRAPLASASFLYVLHLGILGACDVVGRADSSSFRDAGLPRFCSLVRALLSALQS